MQAVTHLQADKDCGIIHKKRVPGFVPASLKGAFRMFNTSDRVRYAKPQMIEVICQLRFPTILSIEAREPVDFQERIRRIYPLYGRNIEKLPPKVTGQPGNMKLEEQPNVTNYQFATADSSWRVNMTKNFISSPRTAIRSGRISPESSTRCWLISSKFISPRISSASACVISTPSPAATSGWTESRSPR